MYIEIKNPEIEKELKRKALKANIDPSDLASSIIMRYIREKKAKEEPYKSYLQRESIKNTNN